MPALTKRQIPGSSANYWDLDAATIQAQRYHVTSQDPAVPIFREPHACVVGTIVEVIHEGDGDTHLWVTLDGTSKQRFACEITPQQKLSVPGVGQRVRVCGIWRWDDQHGWNEIHPIDYLEEIKAEEIP